MVDKKYEKITNAFKQFVETNDLSLIEGFSSKDIEETLFENLLHKQEPFYKALEQRFVELKGGTVGVVSGEDVKQPEAKQVTASSAIGATKVKKKSNKVFLYLFLLCLVAVALIHLSRTYLPKIFKVKQGTQAVYQQPKKVNVSGRWKLINTLESSSTDAEVESVYNLHLQQKGANIIGQAQEYTPSVAGKTEQPLTSVVGIFEEMTLNIVFLESDTSEIAMVSLFLAVSKDGNTLQGIAVDEKTRIQSTVVATRIK